MKINFVLLASGSAMLPRISHAIFEDDVQHAKKEAERVCAQLSKAGYFIFDLVDVSKHPHADVIIESYRVETPEPVVTVHGKK
ncbi:hypothetical protein EVB81_094 [Rhizobium phage RHph_I46]|uniref:Uncharacterized protein n=1 Tax=Rhizobium phage RHph_I1_9 TaxID=2509729 RepID=A0A7S5UWP9_9CAUD|nr:hypothetical protein PP936_gp093 [Rhizobium phage RHph_I1_9]QIG69663.1 hypothetical protein EVB81_094 [Rhizobium phage RHph_I46]QIG70944.1 hypothetical protein EVB92_094 [Rhizobium phage RHph_I9]QIG73530.1 hypothetical protein EVC04_093 [Rhizobium phage RHph_I1_9]QIG76283.1 hypothetical protein EVC25_094 [Rhizobium phage RHph_I34]